MKKRVWNEFSPPGGEDPINLNGRKAARPEKLAGQPWKPTGHTNSAGKQRDGGYFVEQHG